MRIIVLEVNRPCSIKGVPDLMVHYDVLYTFDIMPYVHDQDQDEELIFTTNDLRCNFVGTVLTIFYPMGMNNTVNPVTITVVDGEYSSSITINITVSDNYPPELFPGRPVPDHTFQEDNPTRYPIDRGLEYYFTDAEDGQTLQFQVFSLNSNVSALAFKNATDVWKTELNTTQNYYGTSDLLIRAIDSSGAIVEQTLSLRVTPVPDAPALSLPSMFNVTVGQQALLQPGDLGLQVGPSPQQPERHAQGLEGVVLEEEGGGLHQEVRADHRAVQVDQEGRLCLRQRRGGTPILRVRLGPDPGEDYGSLVHKG